jgi:hypothetical protein
LEIPYCVCDDILTDESESASANTPPEAKVIMKNKFFVDKMTKDDFLLRGKLAR